MHIDAKIADDGYSWAATITDDDGNKVTVDGESLVLRLRGVIPNLCTVCGDVPRFGDKRHDLCNQHGGRY